MRIGINAVFQARGGSLNNLIQLFREWCREEVLGVHQFVLFVSRGTLERLGTEVPKEFKVVVINEADGGLLARLLVEQTGLVRRIQRENLDVLFCPGNTMPFAVRVPCVVTFQNAAPFCDTVSVASVGVSNALRFRMLGFLLRMSALRARRVVFVSNYFRDLFVSRFRFPPARGTVIYRAREAISAHATAEPALLATHGIRPPYVLTVSHLYPYKNLTQLIEGFSGAVKNGPWSETQLVIVGGDYLRGYQSSVRNLIASLGLDSNTVVLTGEIPQADVLKLLRSCEIFAFSSTCENCPTALVEALSAGVPIACSRTGVMPEIAGDGALYFDPFDSRDIARTLSLLMSNEELRRSLSEKALRRSDYFPDSRTVARQTLATIEAAGQPAQIELGFAS